MLLLLADDDCVLDRDARQSQDSVQISSRLFDNLLCGDWFIGKVNIPFSLEGMSGGPIYGFEKNKDGKWEYRLVALQSRWFATPQVLYGCPISPVMSVIEDEIKELQKELDEEDANKKGDA